MAMPVRHEDASYLQVHAHIVHKVPRKELAVMKLLGQLTQANAQHDNVAEVHVVDQVAVMMQAGVLGLWRAQTVDLRVVALQG